MHINTILNTLDKEDLTIIQHDEDDALFVQPWFKNRDVFCITNCNSVETEWQTMVQGMWYRVIDVSDRQLIQPLCQRIASPKPRSR